MQEKLIPFRSQSHNLNEFYRQVTSDINLLYEKYNQLEADMETMIAVTRIQEAAVASKVRALKSELERPVLQPDGLWRQVVPAAALFPDINGLILAGYNLATLRTEAENSLLTVTAQDGTVLAPQALKVDVSPDAGYGGTETNPLCAIYGNMPWWRQVTGDSETNSTTAVYTVQLPVEVLDRAVFNQIRIITFPLYTVSVEKVEYMNQSTWQTVENIWPGDNGMILIPVPQQTAQAVRVTLKQSTPQYSIEGPVYHLGLASFNVEMVVPTKEKAIFTATVDMAGVAPWKLEQVEIVPDTPDYIEWEIASGGTTIKPHNLPADIVDGRLNLKVSMTTDSQLYRPVLRRIELYYRDSSSDYI